MTGHVFTQHDLLVGFLLGIGLGLLVGGLGVLAFLVDRDIDTATTLPAPSCPAVPVDDETARVHPTPVIDLPRRGPREWSA